MPYIFSAWLQPQTLPTATQKTQINTNKGAIVLKVYYGTVQSFSGLLQHEGKEANYNNYYKLCLYTLLSREQVYSCRVSVGTVRNLILLNKKQEITTPI